MKTNPAADNGHDSVTIMIADDLMDGAVVRAHGQYPWVDLDPSLTRNEQMQAIRWGLDRVGFACAPEPQGWFCAPRLRVIQGG